MHAVIATIQRLQIEGPRAIGPSVGLRARTTEQGIGHQSRDFGKVAEAGDNL